MSQLRHGGGSRIAARIAAHLGPSLAGVDEGEGADGRYNALQDAWERVRAEADLPGSAASRSTTLVRFVRHRQRPVVVHGRETARPQADADR